MDKHILLGCASAAMACAFGAMPAGAAVTVIAIAPASCTDGSCGNGENLSQSLGDSALADVSHRVIKLDGSVYLPSLQYWGSGYGDLAGVAFADGNATGYKGQWFFTPTAGYEVSLIGFDAACYQNRASCQTLNFTVTDLAGNALGSGAQSTDYPTHTSALVNSAYSASGIVLTWGPDAYDVGLDNIAFDVRAVSGPAVPEPSTWAMLLGGFLLVGGAMRRRRTMVAFA